MSGQSVGTGIFGSITKFFRDLWEDAMEFFTELPMQILDMFLSALATIINAIPVPDFMSTTSLGALIPNDIAYFLAVSNFAGCLAIIASGITFYLLRRLLTLGIW